MGQSKLQYNKAAWLGMGRGQDQIFTHPLSETRLGFIKDALSSMGVAAQDIADIKGLLPYDAPHLSKFYGAEAEQPMQGRFLIALSDGALSGLPKQMVLHVKPYIYRPTYELSNDVFSFLNEQGIQCPSIVKTGNNDIVRHFKDYDLLLAKYLDGKHIYPDAQNIKNMAGSIAALDNALSAIPEPLKNRIIKSFSDTATMKAEGKTYLSSDEGQKLLTDLFDSEQSAILKQLISDYEKNEKTSAVITHGDLIEGNIVTNDKGTAFLDFDGFFVGQTFDDLGMAVYRAGINQIGTGAFDYRQEEPSTELYHALMSAAVSGYNNAKPNTAVSLETLGNAMIRGSVMKLLLSGGQMGETPDAARDKIKLFGTMALETHNTVVCPVLTYDRQHNQTNPLQATSITSPKNS